MEERRRDKGPRVARPVSSSGDDKRRHVAVSIRNGRLVFVAADRAEIEVAKPLGVAFEKTTKATWAGQ